MGEVIKLVKHREASGKAPPSTRNKKNGQIMESCSEKRRKNWLAPIFDYNFPAIIDPFLADFSAFYLTVHCVHFKLQLPSILAPETFNLRLHSCCEVGRRVLLNFLQEICRNFPNFPSQAN